MEANKLKKSAKNKKSKGGEIKRTKALNILALVLILTYILVIAHGFLFSWNISKVWFSFFIALVGVYLITRGLFFHLDSNYLLGDIFFGFGVFSGINFFENFDLASAIYFALLALSFLSVYMIFRQNIYIISFALSCLEVLLLIINKYLLSIITFILLQAMLVTLVFVVFLTVTKIKREKIGAVSDG